MKRTVNKLLSVMLAWIVLASMCLLPTGCNVVDGATDAVRVPVAIEMVTAEWKEIYRGYPEMGDEIKIVYTQVYHIASNSRGMDEAQKEIFDEYLSGVDAIVSFTILSDYLGSNVDGYLSDIGMYQDVVFYRDGRVEVASAFMKSIGNRTYNFDYSAYIRNVVDCGNQYNRTIKLD